MNSNDCWILVQPNRKFPALYVIYPEVLEGLFSNLFEGRCNVRHGLVLILLLVNGFVLFRLDKKTELSIAQQDFFLPVTQCEQTTAYMLHYWPCHSTYHANTWIWRIEPISFVTGVPSLLLLLWLFFFVALDSDNSSEIHNTGLSRFRWTYLHVDSCCQSPIYIYIIYIYIFFPASMIFDIPDSILKVLLLEWHQHHFFRMEQIFMVRSFHDMFDWRRSVLTAQELIVNIWNTLAAQSAHSSLIARLCWLAVYLYMNRIGNTRNIMRMYTYYVYILHIYIYLFYT